MNERSCLFMSKTRDKIKVFLNEPVKSYSKASARATLRKCGILDTSNRVRTSYKSVIVSQNKQ